MFYHENKKIADKINKNKDLLYEKKEEFSLDYIKKNNGKYKNPRWFTLYGNVYDLTTWFKIHNHALGKVFNNFSKMFENVSGKELVQGDCAIFRSHIFVESDYRRETVLTLLINNRIGEVKNYQGKYKLYPTLEGMKDINGKVYTKDPEGNDEW